MCGQATCSMSLRMCVEGHPPGLLLVFYRLWDQIQSGMSVGVIQSQWGTLSWWCSRLLPVQVATVGGRDFKFKIPDASQAPTAPPKDDYIYESEDESQSPLRQAPARVFRDRKLKIHKTYNGPVPLTYVDTGVYEGGGNDYYEAYTEQDLCWARRLNYVLEYHQIPRWEACNYKTKM